MYSHVCILVAALFAGGCTTVSLERATLSQSASLADLRYREVVENLAMVAHDPATLPAFSTFYAGTSDVSDVVQLSAQSVWLRYAIKSIRTVTAFSTETLDGLGSRTIKKNWTLDPTVVPEKLEAMRAACRWVICGPERLNGSDALILSRYRPPDPPSDFTGSPDGFYFDVADKLACLPPGWLHIGRCRDVPHGACYVASCYGTYVWVLPDGLEGLSRFSLVLQGIARVNLESVHLPSVVTTTVESRLAKSGNTQITMTVLVDANGFLVPAAGVAAIPRKVRVDNVGINADLRSVINASVKSP